MELRALRHRLRRTKHTALLGLALAVTRRRWGGVVAHAVALAGMRLLRQQRTLRTGLRRLRLWASSSRLAARSRAWRALHSLGVAVQIARDEEDWALLQRQARVQRLVLLAWRAAASDEVRGTERGGQGGERDRARGTEQGGRARELLPTVLMYCLQFAFVPLASSDGMCLRICLMVSARVPVCPQGSQRLLAELQEQHQGRQEAGKVCLRYCMRQWQAATLLGKEGRQARMRRHATLAKVGGWLTEVQQKRKQHEEQVEVICRGPPEGEDSQVVCASLLMSCGDAVDAALQGRDPGDGGPSLHPEGRPPLSLCAHHKPDGGLTLAPSALQPAPDPAPQLQPAPDTAPRLAASLAALARRRAAARLGPGA